MTHSSVNELNAVAVQGNKSEAPFMHCPIAGKNVTKNECMSLTVDVDNNKICIRHKCPSPFKACPSCLRFGDIREMGHIGPTCCQKGKDSCATHILWGANSHRSISEREEELAKYKKKLLETQATENEVRNVNSERKIYLQKEEEKKAATSRQNTIQYKDRKEHGLSLSPQEQALKDRIQLIANAAKAADAIGDKRFLLSTPSDNSGELSKQALNKELVVEKNLMFKETIAEMSQVEMIVEKQEEAPEERPSEAKLENPDGIQQEIESDEAEEVLPKVEVEVESMQEESLKEEVEQKKPAKISMIMFSCPLRTRKKMIGEQRCTTFCKQFAHNKKCQEANCKSPWLICIACLGHGEYPRYGEECYVHGLDERTNQLLCETHLEIGYQKKREGHKKSTLIPDVNIEKLSFHTGAVEDVLARVVTATSSFQGNEQKTESEKEKQALQKETQALQERNSKLLALIRQILKEKKQLQALIDLGQNNNVSNEALESAHEENAKLLTRIKELEEKQVNQVNNEEMLVAKNVHCGELQAQLKSLQEKDVETESSLQDTCAKNSELEKQVSKLQVSLLSKEEALSEKSLQNIGLQMYNMQLQKDFRLMQDCMWNALGRKDYLLEIMLDLESELRATTTAILNQQKYAALEKEELLRKIGELKSHEKKEELQIETDLRFAAERKNTSCKSISAAKLEEKKELPTEKQKPKRFNPTIWGLWGTKK